MTLPHTMVVTRLSTSSAHKESYTTRPDVSCFLQPATETDTQLTEAQPMGKTSKAYVEFTANVKVKDRVTVNGVTYNVSGSREHQYGTFPHKVLILTEL